MNLCGRTIPSHWSLWPDVHDEVAQFLTSRACIHLTISRLQRFVIRYSSLVIGSPVWYQRLGLSTQLIQFFVFHRTPYIVLFERKCSQALPQKNVPNWFHLMILPTSIQTPARPVNGRQGFASCLEAQNGDWRPWLAEEGLSLPNKWVLSWPQTHNWLGKLGTSNQFIHSSRPESKRCHWCSIST